MSEDLQKDGDYQRLAAAFDHAWRYFALHSEQRTTVFNFFVASSGLTLSGLGYVLATSSLPGYFGVVAGLGATLLAFTFWKLDQRVVQLIKTSEAIMMETERRMFRGEHRVLCVADEAPVNVGVSIAQPWSYSRSFRTLFVLTAFLGLAGAGTSLVALMHIDSISAAAPHATANGGASARKEAISGQSSTAEAPRVSRRGSESVARGHAASGGHYR